MTRTTPVVSLIAAAALLFASGCAGPAQQVETETLLPQIDVVQVKEDSDEALKIAQEAKLDVEALNTKITEIDNKIILLSEEISSVSIAKIEELENRMTLLIEAYKDLQAQINAIEVLPRVRVNKKKAKPQPPSFSPNSSVTLLNPSTEYEEYHAALRVFNARNYQKAIELFSAVYEKFPQGTYADNCVYWIGEANYSRGDFAAAVSWFKKVFSFPNTSKADDAQLKIGLSYLKLGQYGNAKAQLKHLVDRYPASEYVPRAKKYLADMK